MARYKLGAGGGVIRDDGLMIPKDSANIDYRDYLQWVNDGGTPDPADPAPVVYIGSINVTGRVTTTNATPAELFRRTLAPLTAYIAAVTVIGIDQGNGNVRYIEAALSVKRLQAGAVIVNNAAGNPATTVADHRDGAAGTWAITPSVNGNDFVVTVTGAAGRSIDWHCWFRVQSFSPGGQS